jgi:hypothetical protein
MFTARSITDLKNAKALLNPDDFSSWPELLKKACCGLA